MSRRRSRETSALFGTPIAAAEGSISKAERATMAARMAEQVRSSQVEVNLLQFRPTDSSVEEAKELRRQSVDIVARLHALDQTEGPGSVEARKALAALARAIVSPYRSRRVVPQPPFLRLGSRVEEWFSGKVGTRVNRWTLPVGLAQCWTLLGIALTVVVAACLVAGWPQAALFLVVARLVVSSTLPTPGLPADGGKASIWRISWSGCVAGHLSDAIALFGVSGYLISYQRTGWGFLVGLVPLVMLASTLLRVAALQDGIWIQRLYVERVLRSGALVLGLALAVLLQPEGPGTTFPVIVLSTTGAALFALMEAARTIYYARERQRSGESEDEKLTRQMAAVVEISGRKVG